MDTPGDDATEERRSPLTGRAVVLLLVVAALVVSSVVPMRAFFEQRAELTELREETRAQQERVAALEAQKARWDDPAYVEAQARDRLHFVMPGEVGYVVLEPAEAPDPETAAREAAKPTDPWYATLWGSVQAADEVPDDTPAAERVVDPERAAKKAKKNKKSDRARG